MDFFCSHFSCILKYSVNNLLLQFLLSFRINFTYSFCIHCSVYILCVHPIFFAHFSVYTLFLHILSVYIFSVYMSL